jgi:hypothetical protein
MRHLYPIGKESGMVQGKRKTAAHGRKPSKGRASERRQSLRFFLIWGPVILLAIIFLYALVFDPERPVGSPLSGVVTGTGKSGSGESAPLTLFVALDDGRQVEAVATPTVGSQLAAFTKGRRVLVQESTTTIFRRHHFAIVKPLD